MTQTEFNASDFANVSDRDATDSDERSSGPGSRSGFEPSLAVCAVLAALSVGAGAIHLAMAPQHAPESRGIGLAFVAAGWMQIGFGIAIIAAPRRLWLQLAIVANLAFVAVWALSRTAGLPAWTGDGGTEAASSVDIICVVFEVGIVIGAAALMVAPDLLKRLSPPALVIASAVPIAILLGTTALLVAPSTASHVHGAGADHGDLAAGETHDHTLDASGEAAAVGHTHSESTITYDELPPETKSEVDVVIAAWATKYPTAAEATSAGWIKGTPSLYGIGSHYIKDVNGFSVAKPFDLLNPSILLYDGEGPDAKFAGVSYIVAGDVEGFTGPYDSWHAHASVCIDGGEISLTDDNSPYWYSESECTAASARVMPLNADKMMHLWIGPGYTDAPIFAHDNPKLYNGYYPKQAS